MTGRGVSLTGISITGCYNYTGTWGAYSDGRFKNNVKEDVKGLEFIKKLRPVTYNLDTKNLEKFLRQDMKQPVDSAGNNITDSTDYTQSMSIFHSGLIAQEVEQALTECGYKSSIVSVPTHANEPYGLSYSEFVVPLIKAVQEQQKIIDTLKTEIAALKGAGQKTNDNSQGKAETTFKIELANKENVILYQNEPNPFDGSTVIRYFIPDHISGSAFVVFYDMYGKEVNKIEIKEKGFGKIEAITENLANGIYSYSIVVNDKVIDTKKMLKSK